MFIQYLKYLLSADRCTAPGTQEAYIAVEETANKKVNNLHIRMCLIAVERKDTGKGMGVAPTMETRWPLKALLGRWHLRRGLGISGESVLKAERKGKC